MNKKVKELTFIKGECHISNAQAKIIIEKRTEKSYYLYLRYNGDALPSKYHRISANDRLEQIFTAEDYEKLFG